MGEVFGTAYIETGRDKLKALMDALITSMATDDPKISYAYDGHHTADIRLPGVTVDFESADWDDSYPSRPTIALYWAMTFSLRVHAAYVGGIMDGVKTSRLLNSLCNKLCSNRDLDDGYHISQVGGVASRETFGHTLGGTVVVIVNKFVEHTQE